MVEEDQDMVRILNEKGGRKRKRISEKDYVANMLKNIADGLLDIQNNINAREDEKSITQLANYEAQIKNILTNLTYTE